MRYFLIVLLLFFRCNNPIWGCTCIGDITVERAIKESQAVFIGRILSMQTIVILDSSLGIKDSSHTFSEKYDEYKVLVSSLYKGKISSDTIRLLTNYGKWNACGYIFEIGRSYIVYASYKDQYFDDGEKVPKFLFTTECTRTRPATDVNEIGEIEKRRKNKMTKYRHRL